MEPRTCVVTGGARGIGRALAAELVVRGHRVVLTDLDGAAALRTAEEVGAVAGVQQDVRDPASHRDVAALAQEHGSLGAWFANAGVAFDEPLVDLDDDQVRTTVEVNLLGVLWSARAALEAFGERGGDLVLTASLSGLGPVPGLSVYAATKAAVVSLATSLQAETPRGVRVHAVCPDGVATPMLEGMRSGSEGRRLVLSGGHVLTPEQVATAAVDLLGSRRVVRTLPGWRGAMLRGGALAPSLAPPLLRAFAAQGAWRERRSKIRSTES